jgi:uncharacterized lipoprotein
MRRTLVLFLSLLTINLAGCSSTQQVASYDHQYCHTDETIIVQNGTDVSSATKVQCTDKPRVEHVVKDIGVASDCRISRPLDTNRGDPKAGETLLCMFTDHRGNKTWRPVNAAFAYPSFD